jgi:hypothetical protein
LIYRTRSIDQRKAMRFLDDDFRSREKSLISEAGGGAMALVV